MVGGGVTRVLSAYQQQGTLEHSEGVDMATGEAVAEAQQGGGDIPIIEKKEGRSVGCEWYGGGRRGDR